MSVVFILFVVFKQKTAYEMRISDWSSDVCSSDLQVSADSAPAGGATVTATNLATGLTRSGTSSASGSYNLAGLPPGTYRVDVTADGQTSSQTLTLAVGQTVTLNLGLGGVPETGPAGEATDLDTVVVTVPAMVETKTSEVATYVTQKQIDSLKSE